MELELEKEEDGGDYDDEMMMICQRNIESVSRIRSLRFFADSLEFL